LRRFYAVNEGGWQKNSLSPASNLHIFMHNKGHPFSGMK